MPIRMLPPEGGAAIDVPDDRVDDFVNRGFRPQSNVERATSTVESERDDYYSRPAAKLAAGGLAVGRVVTGGITDAAIRAFGSDQSREDVSALREHNSKLSTGLEIGGALLPGGVAGLASKAGKTGTTIASAARGAAIEGGIMGAGQGVSEIALSKDPITLERAASVIGSHALFGAATGGAVGGATKAIGKGLRLAKNKLDGIAAKGVDQTVDASTDLAGLDAKGLRAAAKVEQEAIEAARVPRRAELADEIRGLRAEMKQNKVWLATKDSDDVAIRQIGKRSLKADKALDNLLDDPKALAESPKSALRQLRIQESALDDLVTKHADNLRVKFAADTSGTRAAALDYATVALEKNRALQAKIAEVAGKPTSARLDAIAERLAAPAAVKGGAVNALGDAAMGYGLGAVAGLPVVGAVVGAARVVAPVLRKLGANQAQVAARASKAVEAMLTVGAKVAPRAPIIASKILHEVSFGPSERTSKKSTLAEGYKARTEEIRKLTQPGLDGKPVMRMSERQKLQERLAPLRAYDPIAADQIESNKARAIEYLAEMQPRMPDLPGMDPDRWQPSDMEMRKYARQVAVVEDPAGVVERLANGSITPEDAETMKAVYPEMYRDIQLQIMSQMGERSAKLPYQRRLALSIFSGVPVDPVLDPRVLAALQGSFTAEEGTEGGIQAPKASPAFGSVTKPSPTAAQERGG